MGIKEYSPPPSYHEAIARDPSYGGVRKFLEKDIPFLVVIMDGGRGTRMDPLNSHPDPDNPFIPKSLIHTVGGIWLVNVGIVAVDQLHPKAYSLSTPPYQKRHIRDAYQSRLNWRADLPSADSFSYQEGPDRGSAEGMIMTLQQYFKQQGIDPRTLPDDAIALVMMNDHHGGARDMAELLELILKNPRATMALAGFEIPPEDRRRYGTFGLREDGKVDGFREKDPTSPSNLANQGMYAIRLNQLSVIEQILNDADRWDIGHDLLPLLAADGRLVAMVCRYPALDFGNLAEFRRSTEALNRKGLPVVCPDGVRVVGSGESREGFVLPGPKQEPIVAAIKGGYVTVEGRVFIGPQASLGRGSQVIGSSSIGGILLPEASVTRSIISPGVIVSPGNEHVGVTANLPPGYARVLPPGLNGAFVGWDENGPVVRRL